MEGKVIIVTGGARGIGAATAYLLAENGAKVIITDLLEEEGQATADKIGGIFYRHDVTKEDDWKKIVASTIKMYGRLDGLVNNAGIATGAPGTPIELETLENFERSLKVNLSGVFLGLKSVVGAMKNSGGGSIVNVASVTGMSGFPNVSGYGASKWGVRGLTKIAATEFGAHKIRVNAISPGATGTPMNEGHVQFGEGNFPIVPLGRIAEPQETAQAIYFLISDASSYISGADLAVDGGWMAQPRM